MPPQQAEVPENTVKDQQNQGKPSLVKRRLHKSAASPEEKENVHQSAWPKEKVSYQEESEEYSPDSGQEVPPKKVCKKDVGGEKGKPLPGKRVELERTLHREVKNLILLLDRVRR